MKEGDITLYCKDCEKQILHKVTWDPSQYVHHHIKFVRTCKTCGHEEKGQVDPIVWGTMLRRMNIKGIH